LIFLGLYHPNAAISRQTSCRQQDKNQKIGKGLFGRFFWEGNYFFGAFLGA
jgi:hypothetical protein